jgi:hypothetical protein
MSNAFFRKMEIVGGGTMMYRIMYIVQRLICSPAAKTPFMSSFSGNCVASVSISTCLWAIYFIPRIGQHISCSRLGRSIMGIYKPLTDTWMWKLELWPRNSFSRNICFIFSAFVLAVNNSQWSSANLQCQPQKITILNLQFFNETARWRATNIAGVWRLLDEQTRRKGEKCL